MSGTLPLADQSDPTAAATVVARLETAPQAVPELLDRFAEVFDSSEAAVSAFEADPCWSVAIHFRNPPNETAVRALVGLAAGAEAANAIRFERLAERDWVKVALDGLPPVKAGRFVVHGAHDRARIAVNRIGIEIEAALAFGTGHHGTTRGCLLALDGILKVRKPKRILDIGTGTGVLAIAAAKGTRRPVLASDIDARAVAIARANAGHNRAATVAVVHAASLADRQYRMHAPYDLVLANILLGPLQRMAMLLARLAAPGARVVLSGILRAQASAALAAYRPEGFALEQHILLEGWSTLVLRRGR
jgi:ribosomal protein L11 methyltransferase